jgi:integrase
MFLREGEVGVNANYLSHPSNCFISSGLVIQFIDAVVISRNRAPYASVSPNFRPVLLVFRWPQITPFLTPSQVLCLFLFLFAPTSPKFQRIVKQVANKAGISKLVTPHVLRHTFSVNCIPKGISTRALMALLGHDRLTTTEIYLKFSPEDTIQEFQNKW